MTDCFSFPANAVAIGNNSEQTNFTQTKANNDQPVHKTKPHGNGQCMRLSQATIAQLTHKTAKNEEKR